MRTVDNLLVSSHPLPHLHAQQGEALQQLPKTERAGQAPLLGLGNAAYRARQLAADQLTEADFQSWLTGLPSRLRQATATAGFAAAGGNWAFRRHVLERRDCGYTVVLQQPLSTAIGPACSNSRTRLSKVTTPPGHEIPSH